MLIWIIIKRQSQVLSQRDPMRERTQQHEQQQQLTLLDQFKQQMLKAWQPVPSLTKTIVMFFILSLIFLSVGIPMIILSSSIQQYSIRYDDRCKGITNCQIVLNVKDNMNGPIFVYYQLHGYYQNHRLYAKSISNKQMKGDNVPMSDLQTDCDPIVYNANISTKIAIDGTPLIQQAVAYPCGVVATTLFTDQFNLSLSTTQIPISSTGIAWPQDIQKFKLTNASLAWTNITDQRFMNWVRIASMPNFRKLWGRIQTNLQRGNYTLSITNSYDISGFGGQKYFVITQSNFFGSKNEFLSITYIVVGGLCLLIGFLFLVKKLMKRRKTQ